MNAQLVEQVHALPEDEQLETLEAILGGITLGMAVKLVPRLEEAWGVEARPQMPDGFGPPRQEAEDEAEPTAFTVSVTEIGSQKIKVIKAIRQINEMDLKGAKGLLDAGLPAVIVKDVDRDTAENAKKQLEEQGATVAIQ